MMKLFRCMIELYNWIHNIQQLIIIKVKNFLIRNLSQIKTKLLVTIGYDPLTMIKSIFSVSGKFLFNY